MSRAAPPRLLVLAVAVGWLHAVPLAAGASPRDDQVASELNNQGVRAAQVGKWEQAVELLRRAVTVNPDDAQLRKNLSGILTDWASQLEKTDQAVRAEPLLMEAVTRDPDNGLALVRLGDLAYFNRSNFADAIAYWKRANGKVAPVEWRAVADRISQAQRDAHIERDFRTETTAHFDIRLPANAVVDLAALSRLLETAYARLQEQLGGGPPRLTVILYTERDLHRTYYQRDWALGFYDGRLRLLGRELGTDLAPMMTAHELAHAFLQHLYGPSLPIWVHEGFAQLQEAGPSTPPPVASQREAGGVAQDVAPPGLHRPRTKEEQRIEEAVMDGSGWVPLKWLDRRFVQPSNREDTWRAYVEARLIMAELLKRHGIARLKRFLEALRRGTAVEAAYDAAFTPDRWSATGRSFLR